VRELAVEDSEQDTQDGAALLGNDTNLKLHKIQIHYKKSESSSSKFCECASSLLRTVSKDTQDDAALLGNDTNY
jgi:hypothetical protein